MGLGKWLHPVKDRGITGNNVNYYYQDFIDSFPMAYRSLDDFLKNEGMENSETVN